MMKWTFRTFDESVLIVLKNMLHDGGKTSLVAVLLRVNAAHEYDSSSIDLLDDTPALSDSHPTKDA